MLASKPITFLSIPSKNTNLASDLSTPEGRGTVKLIWTTQRSSLARVTQEPPYHNNRSNKNNSKITKQGLSRRACLKQKRSWLWSPASRKEHSSCLIPVVVTAPRGNTSANELFPCSLDEGLNYAFTNICSFNFWQPIKYITFVSNMSIYVHRWFISIEPMVNSTINNARTKFIKHVRPITVSFC